MLPPLVQMDTQHRRVHLKGCAQSRSRQGRKPTVAQAVGKTLGCVRLIESRHLNSEALMPAPAVHEHPPPKDTDTNPHKREPFSGCQCGLVGTQVTRHTEPATSVFKRTNDSYTGDWAHNLLMEPLSPSRRSTAKQSVHCRSPRPPLGGPTRLGLNQLGRGICTHRALDVATTGSDGHPAQTRAPQGLCTVKVPPRKKTHSGSSCGKDPWLRQTH